MNCGNWVVVLAFGFWTQQCFSQVSIFPTSPRELDTVRVQLPYGALGLDANGRPDNFDSRSTTLTMANNKITVSLLMVGGNGFGSPQRLDWSLGQLPPGSYQVEVIKRSQTHFNEGLVGSASFTVAPRAVEGAFYNFSDLYFDVNQPGWGMSVTQLASRGLFIIWFAYDNGQPVWYYVSNGTWNSGGDPNRAITFKGPVYKSTGGDLLGSYDPALFQSTPVGTAEVAFFAEDYEMAAFGLTLNGRTIARTVRRQRL